MQEWEPKVHERVVDRRRDTNGTAGEVVRCDADDIAVMATGGIYPEQDCIGRGQTGLTHGDLRALLARLGG